MTRSVFLRIVGVLSLSLLCGALPVQAQTFEEQVAASKPLAPQTGEPQLVAGKKVSAEVCKLAGEPILGKRTSEVMPAVTVVGDSLMVIDADGAVRGYKIAGDKGCTLEVDESFGEGGKLKLEREVETLSAAPTGRVIASHGIFSIYGIQDGNEAFNCKSKGFVRLHESGDWGIGPWVNSTVQFIEFGKFNCKKISDWVLKDLNKDEARQGPFKMVNTAGIVGDTILIGGVLAKSEHPKEPRIVVAYDREGKELFRFGNTEKPFAEDRFGWVHALNGCPPGICALDGNNKRLSVWGTDGEFYGALDLKKLLGLKSPWIKDFTSAPDGSLYVVAGQNRDDSKVAEGLVFRLSGMK